MICIPIRYSNEPHKNATCLTLDLYDTVGDLHKQVRNATKETKLYLDLVQRCGKCENCGDLKQCVTASIPSTNAILLSNDKISLFEAGFNGSQDFFVLVNG